MADLTVRHVGTVCRRVRETRGISATSLVKIAKSIGHPVSAATITRLENEGRCSPKMFRSVVAALRSDNVSPPIDREHAALLVELYDASQKRPEREAILEKLKPYPRVDLDDAPPAFRSCAADRRPAYVADGRYCIHAVNAAYMSLFRLGSRQEYLRRWTAWHGLAPLLESDSPIRAAHPFRGESLPHMLQGFFHDRLVCRNLFTPQFQDLIARMSDLGERNGFPFASWWHLITSLSLPSPTERIPRTIAVGNQLVRVLAVPVETGLYDGLGSGPELERFVFKPMEAIAESAFDHLSDGLETGELWWACDYTDGSFHLFPSGSAAPPDDYSAAPPDD